MIASLEPVNKKEKNGFAQRLDTLMVQHKRLESVVDRVKSSSKHEIDILKSEQETKLTSIQKEHGKQLEELKETLEIREEDKLLNVINLI